MTKTSKLVTKSAAYEYPLQFDFFETETRGLTNTIALWDVAPRGVIGLKAELPDGEMRLIKRSFEYGGATYQLSLAPALFEKDGVEVARYPSEREQLIEEVVRQIAVRRRRLLHSDNGEVGVSFTIYEVFKELVRTGHHFAYPEIREALNILHMSRIEINRVDGQGPKAKERVVSGSTFPMLVWADRSSEESQTVVSFNWLVSQAMMSLNFRQMDYETLMRMPGPIERWLFRYLVHETLFLGRDPLRRKIKASEIINGCGLVKRSRMRDTYRRVAQALTALQNEGIIARFEADAVLDGPRKVDVEYTIDLSMKFARSMKTAEQVSAQAREDFKVIAGEDPKGVVLSNDDRRKQMRRLRSQRLLSVAE